MKKNIWQKSKPKFTHFNIEKKTMISYLRGIEKTEKIVYKNQNQNSLYL